MGNLSSYTSEDGKAAVTVEIKWGGLTWEANLIVDGVVKARQTAIDLSGPDCTLAFGDYEARVFHKDGLPRVTWPKQSLAYTSRDGRATVKIITKLYKSEWEAKLIVDGVVKAQQTAKAKCRYKLGDDWYDMDDDDEADAYYDKLGDWCDDPDDIDTDQPYYKGVTLSDRLGGYEARVSAMIPDPYKVRWTKQP